MNLNTTLWCFKFIELEVCGIFVFAISVTYTTSVSLQVVANTAEIAIVCNYATYNFGQTIVYMH